MKKILLSLIVLFGLVLSASADDVVSGQTYRICTLDGAYALTNGGSSSNDVVLKMAAVNDEDEGQLWEITANGSYWQIKSVVGNVCVDNPSESHAKWSNQVLQWQTSGGNNQKWTFKTAEGGYYMVPYENSSKAYGYNDDGTFTLKTQGDEGTVVTLVRASLPSAPTASPSGFYAIQAVSTYPKYNYTSDGRFLSVSSTGTISLTTDYTYEKSRFYIQTGTNGVATITLPQAERYLYTGTALKSAKTTDTSNSAANHFVFFTNEETLGLNTLVGIHTESTTTASSSEELKFLAATTAGTGVTISTTSVAKSYAFRLVPLPAASDVETLANAIAEATALRATLTGDAATKVDSLIAAAQEELDYPYLTKKDVAADVQDLLDGIAPYKQSTGENIGGSTTSIDAAQTTNVSVSVRNRVIIVEGASAYSVYNAAGQLQPKNTPLTNGTYFVVADGKTYSIAF